jgi:hypothetical protein
MKDCHKRQFCQQKMPFPIQASAYDSHMTEDFTTQCQNQEVTANVRQTMRQYHWSDLLKTPANDDSNSSSSSDDNNKMIAVWGKKKKRQH